MTNTNTFAVGDRVTIENRGGGWNGITGTIKRAPASHADDRFYWVSYDNPADNPLGFVGGNWSPEYLVKLSPEASEIKSGPRATLVHDTSREYALNARSRKALPEWVNDVLTAAGKGEEVDVVEFRKAATQALSLASTRAGQSMGRRQWAREARHLIYWADAILDNHLKGLPVYEGGPRSPKIAELRNEISLLKQAASDERRRLCAEIDREKAARDSLQRLANQEIDAHRAVGLEQEGVIADLEKTRDHLYAEINEAHAALEYAFTLLRSEEDKSRLAGFRDGYATRVNDEA